MAPKYAIRSVLRKSEYTDARYSKPTLLVGALRARFCGNLTPGRV